LNEAMKSYMACLRFDPDNPGAASNLRALQDGVPINPQRNRL
jgi:hypothetical protein